MSCFNYLSLLSESIVSSLGVSGVIYSWFVVDIEYCLVALSSGVNLIPTPTLNYVYNSWR